MQKIFEFITEIIGWIQIVLSPTLIGIILGYAIYSNFQNSYGIICAIFVAILGFILGVIWATKKFKSTGTIHFLSRISTTPDLDNLEKNNQKKTKKNKKICQPWFAPITVLVLSFFVDNRQVTTYYLA